MFLTGAGDLPQFVQAKLMQDLGMLASQDQCKLMALGHLYLTSLNDEISNNVDLKQVSRGLAKEPHIEKSIKSLNENRNLKILGAKSHLGTPPGFPPIQKQVNHTLPSYSQYDSRLIILWTIKVYGSRLTILWTCMVQTIIGLKQYLELFLFPRQLKTWGNARKKGQNCGYFAI